MYKNQENKFTANYLIKESIIRIGYEQTLLNIIKNTNIITKYLLSGARGYLLPSHFEIAVENLQCVTNAIIEYAESEEE